MAREISNTKNFLEYQRGITKVVDITEDITCEEKHFLLYIPNALRGGVKVVTEKEKFSSFEIYDLQERRCPDRTVQYKKFIALAKKFGLSEEEFCTLLLENAPK